MDNKEQVNKFSFKIYSSGNLHESKREEHKAIKDRLIWLVLSNG